MDNTSINFKTHKMGAGAAVAGAQSAVGVGMGIYQTIKGAKEKRDAQTALENYERQDLTNSFDNTAISTLGADRTQTEQARLASGQISALQDSGTRGLIGGLGRVEVGNQNVNQQIAVNLDEQQKAIDFARANDQTRIQSMQENRENADIAALSSQYMAGKQDENTGLSNAVLGAGMLGNQLSGQTGGVGLQNEQQQAVAKNFAGVNPTLARPQPQFINIRGNGMFKQPGIPQSGYGRIITGYNMSGEPIYNQ